MLLLLFFLICSPRPLPLPPVLYSHLVLIERTRLAVLKSWVICSTEAAWAVYLMLQVYLMLPQPSTKIQPELWESQGSSLSAQSLRLSHLGSARYFIRIILVHWEPDWGHSYTPKWRCDTPLGCQPLLLLSLPARIKLAQWCCMTQHSWGVGRLWDWETISHRSTIDGQLFLEIRNKYAQTIQIYGL